MKIKIHKGYAKGCIKAPPSKSMAHRMLICAGLSKGVSTVHGIAESEDVLATIDCLKALGAKIKREGDTVSVTGLGASLDEISDDVILKCRESGSTLRFFIPICLAMSKPISLTGSERLLERPLGIYEDICREKDMFFSHKSGSIKVEGPLKAGTYKMAGNVSSQFVSGLLFALPLLDGESKIELIPPVESRSYIDMTIDALSKFGIEVYWDGENTLIIPGQQTYMQSEVSVEGDYSNGAFFEALNVLGGQVQVENLNNDTLQGDRVYIEMFECLKSEGKSLDISDCPDLGPILFSVAAALNGGCFTGTARLRIKESDRATVMAEELAKFGVNVDVEADRVIVETTGLKEPKEELYGHNDHRIVMSNAVLSTVTGGIIEGAEAVAKSFPDFFEKLSLLGIEVEKIAD